MRLSQTDESILEKLRYVKWQRISEIAEREGITIEHAARRLRELCDRGHVEKQISRRGNNKGKKVYRKLKNENKIRRDGY